MKQMRIGFDAKKLVSNFTGIGNYSRGVVNALSTYFPKNNYLLFAPVPGNNRVMQGLTASSAISVVCPSKLYGGRLGREWWRRYGIVSSISGNQIDLFHGLSNELPWGIKQAGCKTVVTIHDLIFLRHPETYSWADRNLLTWKTKYACQQADCIIACSQQTADDLVTFYHLPEEKIRVVYQSCSTIFSQAVDGMQIQALRARYHLPDKYLLCVGTIEERKNQVILLHALARLPHHHLVLVGKRTAYQDKVERTITELGLEGRVHILNGIPTNELPALYQGCSLFLYLSWYEGFGIPVLEAMNSRVPIIAATGSCLEEVGGEACLYCSPHDSEHLATLITHLEQSSDEVNRRVELGGLRTRLFTSDAVARNLMNVYEEVLTFRKG